MAYGGILGKSTTTWTNNQIMSTATAGLYGLGADAVPDDVLSTTRSLITAAQSKADRAYNVASNAGTLKYIYGGYLGSYDNIIINLGVSPHAVFVCARAGGGIAQAHFSYFVINGAAPTNGISITSTGFLVQGASSAGNPNTNYTYLVIY